MSLTNLSSSPRTHVWLWVALMAGASVAFSLSLACAAPLAALATLAALNLRGSDALMLTLAAWAANQAVGYGLLGYPTDATSFAWGALIGLAALAALTAARLCLGLAHRLGIVVGGAFAFVAAFAAFEAPLFVADLGLGHGGAAFTPETIWLVFQINALALAGLALVHALARRLGLPGFAAPPVQAT
ncbi:hypothetical protein [Zavarzinia sp. CC-PAN008]|uniref:hypothetical protein n=1 Tax=Zavarzinia sp. CC-PAN008 TaxID=3243332 RepID=UPI003F74954F